MRVAVVGTRISGNASASTRAALYSLHEACGPVPRLGAAFNTGLASGKINVYTSPALSTRAKH
jgi:hypothetical protein